MENQKEVDKIIAALADIEWDYRTVDGIEKSTGIPAEKIQAIIINNKAKVKKSSVPDRYGRALYTLRSRLNDTDDMFNKIRMFVSKSIG